MRARISGTSYIGAAGRRREVIRGACVGTISIGPYSLHVRVVRVGEDGGKEYERTVLAPRTSITLERAGSRTYLSSSFQIEILSAKSSKLIANVNVSGGD